MVLALALKISANSFCNAFVFSFVLLYKTLKAIAKLNLAKGQKRAAHKALKKLMDHHSKDAEIIHILESHAHR